MNETGIGRYDSNPLPGSETASGNIPPHDGFPREQQRENPPSAQPADNEYNGAYPVQTGWRRYLVASSPAGLLPPGSVPVEPAALFRLLEKDPDIRQITHIRTPRSVHGDGASVPPLTCPVVAVVEMSDERARALATDPHTLVEPDQPLSYPATPISSVVVPPLSPALDISLENPARVHVHVKGQDGATLSGTRVWAIGSASTASSITDTTGWATLVLPFDTPATLRALYARPAGGYWPARIDRPYLPGTPDDRTIIECVPLSETLHGFPEQPVTGWGKRSMRLDQIPPSYRGQGTKIALLDSGINAAHPDLESAVRQGHDFISPAADGSWQTDSTGHGTWCAGVIVAADNHNGISGIAPGSELHSLRIFPNGRISTLLQALNYCIHHGIDLVQVNLTCPLPSRLLAWKILDAHTAGIAVVAPASSTSSPVDFPARLPTVLAVGAITPQPNSTGTNLVTGQPPSYNTAQAHQTTPNIDFLAPGATILTTSTATSRTSAAYTAADSVGLAASHITGLAALLLAHHQQLSTFPTTVDRVTHLRSLLHSACQPAPGPQSAPHTAGIPDAPTALGLPASSDWRPKHAAAHQF